MSISIEEEKLALKNLAVVLNTPAGYNFFLFLLRQYDVLGEIPAGLTPQLLVEEVANQRAGSFLIGYISKSNPSVLGNLMADIAKEKQDDYIQQNPTLKDEPSKPEWER